MECSVTQDFEVACLGLICKVCEVCTFVSTEMHTSCFSRQYVIYGVRTRPWICTFTRGIWQVLSMVFSLSNRLTNPIMFEIIFKGLSFFYVMAQISCGYYNVATQNSIVNTCTVCILLKSMQNINNSSWKIDNFVAFGRPQSSTVIIQLITELDVFNNFIPEQQYQNSIERKFFWLKIANHNAHILKIYNPQ